MRAKEEQNENRTMEKTPTSRAITGGGGLDKRTPLYPGAAQERFRPNPPGTKSEPTTSFGNICKSTAQIKTRRRPTWSANNENRGIFLSFAAHLPWTSSLPRRPWRPWPWAVGTGIGLPPPPPGRLAFGAEP